MTPLRDNIRRATIFYTSIFCCILTLGLTIQTALNEDWWVMASCILGFCLAAISGISVRSQSENFIATYLIVIYLLVQLLGLAFSGYQDGVTTIWMMASPPICMLVLGTKPGALVSGILFAGLFYILLFAETVPADVLGEQFRYRLLVVYLLSAGVCGAYSWANDFYYRQLQAASEELSQLQQLLPICAHCKMVRVEDQWHSIEEYITESSDQKITHGICPDCMKAQLAADRST